MNTPTLVKADVTTPTPPTQRQPIIRRPPPPPEFPRCLAFLGCPHPARWVLEREPASESTACPRCLTTLSRNFTKHRVLRPAERVQR